MFNLKSLLVVSSVFLDEWLAMNAWRLLLDDYMGPFPWRPTHSYEVDG